MAKETLDTLFTGLSINFIYDVLKITFGIIVGYTGCKYLNKSKIKGNNNEVKQKNGKNKSEINGDGNKVEQI